MKNKKATKTDIPDKSLKKNSMALKGENNSQQKKNHVGPEEFEEDLDMKLRMKPQSVKGLKKNQGKD